jgi:hypothetical protein
LGCWAQPCCLAWPRAQADHVRLSQARRQVRSAAVVGRSPVPTTTPVRDGGGSGTLRCAGLSWWPQAPAAVWPGVEAPPCGLHGACRWRVSRHRHQGQGCGMVKWRLVLRHERVGGTLRGGVLWGPEAGRAAVSAGPQQGQARDGGHRAAGRSSKVRWCQAPSIAGPCAVSVAMIPAPPGVAASCAQGGARGGGGSRSPEGPGPGVGLQPPNKGLQATVNSLRSCLAPAIDGA